MKRFESSNYSLYDYELRELAKKYGVESVSKDLLYDLSMQLSGKGKPRNPLDLKADLLKEAPVLMPNAKGDYLYKGKQYSCLSEFQEAWVDNQYENIHKPIMSFVGSLPNDGSVPGKTPLKKAVNVVRKLNQKHPNKTEDTNGGMLPMFDEPEELKAIKDEIRKDIEIAANMDDLDRLLASEGNEDDDGAAFLNNDELFKFIFRVEQAIRAQSRISPTPRARLLKDIEGTELIPRSSRGISDLPYAPTRALLTRRKLAAKLIQGQVSINDRYQRERSTPLLAMLLDKSGSMRGTKAMKGLGILWYLVKEVAEGNCIGLFSFFESECIKFHVLDPEKMDVIEWFRGISKSSFSMGGTNVKRSILQILDEISELEKVYDIDISQKEVVAVNDGQDDTAGLKKSDLKGAKLHAFILQNENEHLGNIAMSSGGLYKNDI